MAKTHFSGPIIAGTSNPGEKSDGTAATGGNQGYVALTQSGLLAFNATLVSDLTFTLPANTQILDVYVDVLTAFDSATSATLSIGTTSGGTTYMSGVNAKTINRAARYTFTGAQATAIANITTNTSVVATVTSVGQPAAGNVRITLVYVQK